MLNYCKYIYNTYINKQMLILLALGFASGFPYLLIFGTLSYWLNDFGIALGMIGAFSLVKLPYALKWAWSPLVDNVKIPLLYKMGRRRSWAVVVQILLFVAIFLMSLTDPQKHLHLMAALAFITCFLSATQDIVLDAYRVECFLKAPEKQASGVAIFVLGYRLALIFSGAGAIYLASIMDWSVVYKIMACATFVGFITILLAKEPLDFKYEKYAFKLKDSLNFLQNSVVAPFKDFIKREHWFWILVLIFLYHLSNAYCNPMLFPFYDSMGFSKAEVAAVMKIYGMIAAILGGLAGGIIVLKAGLKKSMLIFGVLQCLSTLLFSLQAVCGHNIPVFILVIVVENFCSGLVTTALVAYISSLCNKLYTATQYALLSSVTSISRDIFSSSSGFLAEHVSWEAFFAISSVLSLPSLIIIWFCVKDKK